MKNKNNFEILNRDLVQSMNAFRTIEYVFVDNSRMDDAKLNKFADIMVDTFKIFFEDKYGKEPMSDLVGNYDVALHAEIKDNSHGMNATFELDLLHMMVLDARPSTLKGHQFLDRLLNWMNEVNDFSNVSIEFKLLLNNEPFPDFEFTAVPNDFVFRPSDSSLFLVKEFAKANATRMECINAITGDLDSNVEVSAVTKVLEGEHLMIARGLSTLGSLDLNCSITEYPQFINFLNDELGDYEEGDEVRIAITDMMEAVCRSLFGRYKSEAQMFRAVIKDVPDNDADVISDMMVYGGANGFGAIKTLGIKDHDGFENLLKTYATLDNTSKACISIFLNNSSDVIEACITKYLGKQDIKEADKRAYYHGLILCN